MGQHRANECFYLGQYRTEKLYLGQSNTEKQFYLGQYRNNSVWDDTGQKKLLFEAMKDRKVLIFGTIQEETRETPLSGTPSVSAITCSSTMDRYITSVVVKSSSSCSCTTTHNANHRHQPATAVLIITHSACNYSWQQRKQQPRTQAKEICERMHAGCTWMEQSCGHVLCDQVPR